MVDYYLRGFLYRTIQGCWIRGRKIFVLLLCFIAIISTLPLILPKIWRNHHIVQTFYPLLVPFTLDYLLLIGVLNEVNTVIIPLLLYVGMHAILLTESLTEILFPEWLFYSITKTSIYVLSCGGLLGALTLSYQSIIINIACGAISFMVIFLNIGYWSGEISTVVTLRCMCLVLITLSFILHFFGKHAITFATGILAMTMLIQSFSVSPSEHRFGEESH